MSPAESSLSEFAIAEGIISRSVESGELDEAAGACFRRSMTSNFFVVCLPPAITEIVCCRRLQTEAPLRFTLTTLLKCTSERCHQIFAAAAACCARRWQRRRVADFLDCCHFLQVGTTRAADLSNRSHEIRAAVVCSGKRRVCGAGDCRREQRRWRRRRRRRRWRRNADSKCSGCRCCDGHRCARRRGRHRRRRSRRCCRIDGAADCKHEARRRRLWRRRNRRLGRRARRCSLRAKRSSAHLLFSNVKNVVRRQIEMPAAAIDAQRSRFSEHFVAVVVDAVVKWSKQRGASGSKVFRDTCKLQT